MNKDNFDDIRPLYNSEVPAAIEQLLESKLFEHALRFIKPEIDWEEFSQQMKQVKTIDDFKCILSYDAVMTVARKTTFSLTISGRSRLPKGHMPCTFISNHRDIVLDAAFLNVMLYDVDYGMTQVAIGDNLLISPWIKILVRLNNSFIVKRGVVGRQQLEASKKLSAYIHHTIKNTKESVWIAQREGRAKDSDDKTQSSILKMLNMGGGDKDIIANLMELNIVPVAISYEFDPCDYLKAKEFQHKRDFPDFQKSKRDDLLNMETGILNNKGRVHFTICTPINDMLKTIDRSKDKTEIYNRIANIIDAQIYKNYRFYPCNYIAYDMLAKIDRFANNYSAKDKKSFENYLNTQLDKISIPDKDETFLVNKMLEMYANPLRNYIKVMEEEE